MIISKLLALLIGKVTEDLKRAQIAWEVTRRYHWIQDIDRSIDWKFGGNFCNNNVNFTLHLKKDFYSKFKGIF